MRTAALILAGALVLSGCASAGSTGSTGSTESTGSSLEQLPPALGGLPAGTPARPATPYQYPAVHDMPPPRATRPMSEDDVLKAEKDLQSARDRQEQRVGGGTPAAVRKKTTPATKKHPADTKNVHGTGAKTNP